MKYCVHRWPLVSYKCLLLLKRRCPEPSTQGKSPIHHPSGGWLQTLNDGTGTRIGRLGLQQVPPSSTTNDENFQLAKWHSRAGNFVNHHQYHRGTVQELYPE